jgi:CRP/FNR family transcriptional regulator, anaerobic regulatory protein
MRLDMHSGTEPVLCRACEARHRGICDVLDSEHLLRLGQYARRQTVGPGIELMAAGERPERYANILSGVVKLSKVTPDGRQQVVGLQFAPDFLGRPFTETSDISAVTASAVCLCLFPRTALETLACESPDLMRQLHQQALRELDEARDWILTLGRKTATERVASFLLLVARHIDPERAAPVPRFDIPLDRASIADFLGLTVETVSRQLTGLRKAGIIAIGKSRHITVPDYPALEAVSGS